MSNRESTVKSKLELLFGLVLRLKIICYAGFIPCHFLEGGAMEVIPAPLTSPADLSVDTVMVGRARPCLCAGDLAGSPRRIER
jgi:hypothetical protein